MSDFRIVQCFGVKKRPHKQDEICRSKYLWIASGTHGNFGRKGTRACPNCGTMPDFKHPYNQHLVGDMTLEEAEAAMPAYIQEKRGEK